MSKKNPDNLPATDTDPNEELTKIESKKLSFDLKQAFHLRFDKGLSYGEIGRLLNVPKPTVYWNLKKFESIIKEKSNIQLYRENKAV